MPADRSGCDRMNAASWRRGSTLGSMRYWMFGRSKLATKCRAEPSRSRSVISRCVAGVAVAVSASRGTPGNRSREIAERQVVGTEVVAPLRHAVRLVDRDDAEPAARQQGDEAARPLPQGQPLGSDVEQIEVAGEVRPLDAGSLGGSLRRVEVCGAHAVGDERVDLVVHERDERAHHETGAFADERGHLVADALAAAGRHQHDGVAAGDDVVDDRLLLVAERVEPVDLAEHRTRIGADEVAAGRPGESDFGCRKPGGRPAETGRRVGVWRLFELGRRSELIGIPHEVRVGIDRGHAHPFHSSRGIRPRPPLPRAKRARVCTGGETGIRGGAVARRRPGSYSRVMQCR